MISSIMSALATTRPPRYNKTTKSEVKDNTNDARRSERLLRKRKTYVLKKGR